MYPSVQEYELKDSKMLQVKNFTLSNISETESNNDGSRLSRLEEQLKKGGGQVEPEYKNMYILDHIKYSRGPTKE